ncbi:MAG: formate dehydrogenase accessory sulfurtransferase FdhD [Dehalococcoidia bacterium]|nr:formate dehydrogenase accessory sulfurtransferase FdhD [Dehalococcoidia bacterium]
MSTGLSHDLRNLPSDEVEKVAVQRFTAESQETVEDIVVREFPLTIMLNGTELVTLLCSPANLKYLAIGFLFSEGLLKGRDDLKRVTVDERKGVVRVETKTDVMADSEAVFKRLITPGCGRGASFYSAADTGLEKIVRPLTVTGTEILELMKTFQHHSLLYRETHGVHSAALCNTRKILIFTEDIGRHNAIDKIFGECLDKGIPTDDGIILSSGRMSSEIVIKVARRKVPVLVSKSAPTNTAVKLADELGLTLIGFVRGTRMNVYTHAERVTVSRLELKS